ncbi:MAG: LacI family DNA-binding transcriptional regulator [Rhodobacter sp.]|nr:LacI family DNA-binding transcriptional regulator [Rhodobacter sp.]
MIASETRNRLQESASRVRVTDVAQLAGCAPATVSRALNNPDKVSPEKRARVERAMLELGYVRNHAARALRSQRSNMVGVLIPTLDYALYARMVGAANATFSEAGISTLIATFNYDLDAEVKEAKLLLERGAEALMLVGDNHRSELHQMLDQAGVPYVCTYVSNPKSPHPTVGFDNATAAAKLAQHLVHLGHRNIGVISGLTKDNDRTTERLEGIKSELSRHSIELRPSMITESRYSISEGRKACIRLLYRNEPKPTSIICGNDVLALGALVECQARGLRVPEDISVVGFDNLEFSMHSNPPLTTIDVPAEEMGTAAANYILGSLDGEAVSLHNPVEVELILRNSSAPAASESRI